MNEENRIIIAVDPGASGGIAWNEPGEGICAVPMPATETEIVALIAGIYARAFKGDALYWLSPGSDQLEEIKKRFFVCIEKVGGYVKPARVTLKMNDGEPEAQMVGGQPGSAMFKFGRNAGVIMGAFLMLGIEPFEVEPQRWQKGLFLPRGLTYSKRKQQLRNKAQRAFPQVKVTLKTCDALLIWLYASRASFGYDYIPEQEKRDSGQPDAKERHSKREFRTIQDARGGGTITPEQAAKAITEVEAEKKKPRYRLADWKGQKWVERIPDKPGQQGTLIRRATQADLEQLQ